MLTTAAVLKPLLPVGTRVRTVRDFDAYPIAQGQMGTVIAYLGVHTYPWCYAHEVRLYRVHVNPPHRYGDTVCLTDEEIEPLD